MPPDNAVYYHAAYALVAVIYLGYALVLHRRHRRLDAAERELERR